MVKFVLGFPTRAAEDSRHSSSLDLKTDPQKVVSTQSNRVSLACLAVAPSYGLGTRLAFSTSWSSNTGLIVSIFIPGTRPLSFAQVSN